MYTVPTSRKLRLSRCNYLAASYVNTIVDSCLVSVFLDETYRISQKTDLGIRLPFACFCKPLYLVRRVSIQIEHLSHFIHQYSDQIQWRIQDFP